MESLKLARNEIGASKHIPITHLNAPTVFETQSGQVGCVIELAGIAFDTATNEDLNYFRGIWHHALATLGESFCLYSHIIRQKMDVSLTGSFPDAFTHSVDTQYHQQFQKTQLYRNRLYLTILYKGVDSGKVGKSLSFLQKISNKAIKDSRNQYRMLSVSRLQKACEQFMASMVSFKPRLLGSEDDKLGYSDLLCFFAKFTNGLGADDFTPFSMPTYVPSQNEQGVAPNSKVLKLYPNGNIASVLPSKRLFFADYIEFKQESASSYAAMLSTKSYGTESAAIMLDKLLQLDCEFIATNTFAIESKAIGLKLVRNQLMKLENANDAATSQLLELESLNDELASEKCRVGYHHNTIMLLSSDLSHLKQSINNTIKRYNDIGYVVSHETLGQEACFWAQIPGNQNFIVRSTLITSQNFVDFNPLHNYPTGYCNQNHLGSAVTLIETPSKTPLFFNYHSKGSGKKNDLTPGHTTIIGGNGSGKTVFMGFMDSQMSRYGGRSFFFDRDRGLEIYVRATGGVYSVISPEHPKDVRFNPFWLEDTPKNRSFLKVWLAQLVKNDGESELPPSIQSQLNDCVDYAYESLSKEHRCLANAIKLLPMDFERCHRLSRWLKKGDYAYLFDHKLDALDLKQAKVGFDFTHLMTEPKSVLTAVCMYLVHRIQESLDGQRVSLYFDEGWQFLDNDYWKNRLRQDLPTWRKMNAHLVLATQSPESVVNSALSAQFLDNAATNIFFCNNKANFEKHYQHFGLTSSEFDFIKNTPKEKRLFLYKQSQESAIAKLNLGSLTDALAVYSANAQTVKLLEAIRKEHGEDPNIWLPIFYEQVQQLED